MSGVWRTRFAVLVGIVLTALALAAATSGPATPPGPTADPEPATVAGPVDDRAAALVAAEDRRLLGVLRAMPFRSGPYLDRAHGTPTLVLTPAPAPYDLGSLIALGAATRSGSAVDLLTSVFVAPGAQLRIQAPDTELRMASGPGGFTSVVGWDAEIGLAGAAGHPVRVVSRDPTSGALDRGPDDGRAYVRVAGGRLQVADAELTALGFRSGRTGGLAVTGHTDVPGSATVAGTTVRDGEYGLFVEHSRGVQVADSVFTGHRAEGVRLHRGVSDATLRGLVVAGNGEDGIIADRGSSAIAIADVDASGNGGWGVAVEADALADHPDASGRPLGGTSGFRLSGVRATANHRGGIELDGATDARVSGCSVTAGPVGVFVHGGGRDVEIVGCTVVGAGRAGFAVRDGAVAVRLHHNLVGDSATGVQVRDTVVEATANDVAGASRHGLSLIGAVGGSAVRDNVVTGSGPSAIDVHRATGPVVLLGNQVESWEDDLPWWQRLARFFAEHAMLGVWLLVVLVPVLVGHVMRRRSSRRLPRRPALPERAEVAPVLRWQAPRTRVTILDRS